ncbi:HtaA domain-containing protein [Streptomyces litchfieldiae]|uniref:HtaA domain-containing protein n=1 Tax=Streptomyces litchfieldiae TaxID=3075543 RepID=A0ABU2MSY8_9ACTN|nr:HtaA domain-containing protein [Streptomyces sp. DSM 44938]MDT0344581.1 HtaA domain-containing protein [Streptomyces sp. DSM 44938]
MLPRKPHLRARVSFVTAFPAALLAVLLAMLPGTAHAAERTVAGGRLDWGVKSSFQSYVTGPIANGGWSLTGGAATVGESQFRFHTARGTYDPDSGAFRAGYSGGVHFTGHRQENGEHELDLTISNPTVAIDGASGALFADVRSKERGTGEITEAAHVPLADLDLTGVDLRGGTAIHITTIPATLTTEGATAFAGYYQAGDALDPVTLTADTEEPPAPDSTPADDGTGDPTDEPSEEPAGDGEFTDAIVDWGVRRTFREYVTGSIAQGAWELTDGAQDGGALFRFPAGRGTLDAEAGTLEAAFTGGVHFTGTDLDLALGNVTVTVADGTGTLTADVTTAGTTERDQPLITFPAAELAPEDGLVLLQEVPAELTEEGAAAFGGFYQPGIAMDPVTLAVATDPAAELPALPDLGSEPTAQESPEPPAAGADASPSAAADDEDAGSTGSTTALIATGTGAVLALAAAAYLILRRNRRATHPETPEETPAP